MHHNANGKKLKKKTIFRHEHGECPYNQDHQTSSYGQILSLSLAMDQMLTGRVCYC